MLTNLIKVDYVQATDSASDSDEESDSNEEINYTWAIDSFDSTSINVQIVWEDYNLISAGMKRDILYVEVDLTQLDKSAKQAQLLYTRIPKQMSVNETAVVNTVETAA